MTENGDLSQLQNGEMKKTEGKIFVNRQPMNQVQFHETFQLVTKRTKLDMVANHLQFGKDVVSNYLILFFSMDPKNKNRASRTLETTTFIVFIPQNK
jgi:hypothetical protein